MSNVERSLVIVAVALLAVVGATLVVADGGDAADGDGFEYEPIRGGLLVTGYTGDNPVVHVPSTAVYDGTQYNVIGIDSQAFGAGIRGVYLPASVVLVNNSAFYHCTDLQFLSIEGNDIILGSNVFQGGAQFYLRASESVQSNIDADYQALTSDQVAVWFMTNGAPAGVDSCRLVISQTGSSIQVPEDFTIQGYNTVATINGEPIPENYTLSTDVIVDLAYTIQKFTVSFVCDGETVWSGELDYGATITAPAENPTKEQTAQYTYTFTGWNGFNEGMTVTQDVTFEAQFLEELRQYTVKFVSEGETFQESVMDYGAVIVPPEQDPIKESVDGVDFTFTGWDGFTNGMTVSGEHTFTAVFASSEHEYTVRFVSDGEVVSERTYHYGDVIEIPEDPVRESSDGNDYRFTGWEGYTDSMTVSGDHTFTAVFEAVPQQSPDDGGSDTMWIVIVVVIIVAVLVALFLLRKHF